MTNRTRLDSLQQGEKFKFSEYGETWRHLGFDSETGMQAYELATGHSPERYAQGGCYVYPLGVPQPARELTPYDTGERLEPRDWVPYVLGWSEEEDRDAYGKVDFDNEEGRTVLTVWVERTEFGGYAMYVLEHGDGGELDVIHKGTAETLKRLEEED